MKIIHDNGFSQEEINQQKSVVFSNTVSTMAALLRAMNSLNIPLQRREREVEGAGGGGEEGRRVGLCRRTPW